MRQLTIQRRKAYVGSMMKMKVYMEDPAAPELTINGAPCRKLGELKNGGEQSFEIPESETRIFVIADKLSKGYCSDTFLVPAGTEPVRLSGKNRFDLSTGNAFRFDDNPDTLAQTNRKHGKHIGLIVLILSVLVGAVVGVLFSRGVFGTIKNAPKEFAAEGMHITLTKAFTQKEMEPFTLRYAKNDVEILIMRDDYSQLAEYGDLTLEEYAALFEQGNPQVGTGYTAQNGFISYEYEYMDPETKAEYRYFVALYEAPDAFWVFNFVSSKQDYEDLRPEFLSWAESVRFD